MRHTKTKPKPKLTLETLIFKNCSHVSVCHCAKLSYTTQHRTVLIIFPLIIQTIIIAQMLSTGGRNNKAIMSIWNKRMWWQHSYSINVKRKISCTQTIV